MATLDYLVKALGALAILYVVKTVVQAIYTAYFGPLSKIPGPFLHKFNYLPWMITTLRGEAFRNGREQHLKYGNVVRLGPNFVSVADRDSAKKILQEWDLPKSPSYDRFKLDDDVSTLFTERDKVIYRQKRRLLSPGFSISYLNAQEVSMHECTNTLLDVLDEVCLKAPDGRAVVDISAHLAELAISIGHANPVLATDSSQDMITATAFGGSLNLVRNKEHALRTRAAQFFKNQNIYGVLGFLKLIPGSTERRRDPKLYAMLDDILQRRSDMEKQLQKKDLLQIFLDANKEDPKGYTWAHVKADMLLFLLAGSETTSTTLTFALHLLATNPRTLSLLVAELLAAYPDKTAPMTTAQLKDLPYLNAVIHETMRMLPSAANGASRITDRTVVLSDHVIPPNTNLLTPFYTLHHDPQIWGADATTFRPERFIEPGGDDRLRNGMFPFSIGSRNCIGKNFAMMELQLALAGLLRRFEIAEVPGQDVDVKCKFVLSFRAGRYEVEIRRRGK
ncbi:MAG: hypothetical protein Q9160_007798 [Pyrenula sp. 1 TL-2023]